MFSTHKSRFTLIVFLCIALFSGATYPSDKIEMVDAELFGLDRSHSHFGFSVRFLGMSTVKGTFKDYSAAILYNEEDLTKTSVTVVIDVASIDTGNNWRDKDLQSERFFDAEQHPKIIFQSSRIEPAADGFTLYGDLTMRGITHQIAVPFKQTLKRTVDTGWGNIRIGFEGSYSLNRNDYGIHGGDFWGVQALSEEVEIEFGMLGTIMNMEKISYRSRDKPSIGEVLESVIQEEGIEAALERYRYLSTQNADSYNITEGEMNKLGNKLLEKGQLEQALHIFQINAQAYPESAGVFDSLGLIHAMLGNRTETISAYQKAFDLNPHLPSTMEMKRRLGD